MEIIEFEDKYSENVKDLLVELQEHIVEIDDFKLNIMTDRYREEYYIHTFEELSEKNGKMFLAVENNVAIGLICGYIAPHVDIDEIDYVCPKTGIISELVVSKNVRGQGIGQKLIDKIEDYFKICGCIYANIDVFAPNVRAKKLYEKNNYVDRLITMSKFLK